MSSTRSVLQQAGSSLPVCVGVFCNVVVAAVETVDSSVVGAVVVGDAVVVGAAVVVGDAADSVDKTVTLVVVNGWSLVVLSVSNKVLNVEVSSAAPVVERVTPIYTVQVKISLSGRMSSVSVHIG